MNAKETVIAKMTAPEGAFALTEVSEEYGALRIYAKGPKTLRDLLLSMPKYGDQIFIAYEDEHLTFGESFAQAVSVSHWLSDQGIKKGDRVAIGMRNYPEWAIAFFACQAIGAIAVTLNAWWTGDELRYALADTSTKIAVVDGERYDRLKPHLDQLPGLQVLGTRGSQTHGGVAQWDKVLEEYASYKELPDVDVQALDYSSIIFTSGTTGVPKGALHTHRNHVTNTQNMLLSSVASAAAAASEERAKNGNVEETKKAAAQSSLLLTYPFFHIGGMGMLYVCAYTGTKLALMYKWNVDRAIDLISREQVRSCGAVPMLLQELLAHPRATSGALDSLTSMGGGGAPMPKDLVNKVGKVFDSKVAPTNNYGATETTSSVIANSGADYFAHPNSVGKPIVTVDVRTVNDDGQDCPPGETGEIWVRGPNVFAGYWNKPEETEAAFSEGWFKTGDLGYVDAEGFYYVVDRKKDVIIRAGENVYCAQVEDVLHHHPDIADVALIGLPHRDLGEEVTAVLQLHPGSTLNEADIQNYVAEHLARFNVPTKIFFIDEPLPRTATGKVLKRDLKRQYA